jgi:hypothetical protein
MLRKARAEDGSVCHISTLWDTFFEGGREHRCGIDELHGCARWLCLHKHVRMVLLDGCACISKYAWLHYMAVLA